MESSGYISLSLASAMRADLDVTANNIANANTAGFKSEHIAFDTMIAASPSGQVSDFVVDVGSFVDTRQGALTQTGNPLDISLNGTGWLSYRTSEGAIAYGRDGRLALNPDGELQTLSGARVLDSGGGPITLPPDAGEITISADGTISSAAGPLAQIGVFDLPAIQSYHRLGAGMFAPPEGAGNDAIPALDTEVIQGSLEMSNVQPIAEVTRLMDIQKSYDRAKKLIDNEDQLLRDALRRLGRMG